MSLPVERFCSIIEQLGPVTPNHLAQLLSVNKEFKEKVVSCVREINFSDQELLNTPNGYPLDPIFQGDDHEEQLNDLAGILGVKSLLPDIISFFPSLREYRISFAVESNERKHDSTLVYLLRDERARWISVSFPEKIFNGELKGLIFIALRKRIEKYGSNFTFTVSIRFRENERSQFSFQDGFCFRDGMFTFASLIIHKRYTGMSDLCIQLLRVLKDHIHTFGCSSSRLAADVLKRNLDNGSITRLTFFDSFVSGNDNHATIWSAIRGGDLVPYLNRLTEIDFQPGIEFSKPEYEPSDHPLFSLIRAINRDVTFPNIVKFDIPILFNYEADLKRIFPNVKRFYYMEEYELSKATYNAKLALEGRQVKPEEPIIKTIGI